MVWGRGLLSSLLVLAACASTRGGARPLEEAPPPTIRLSLDVRGQGIGLVGAASGPICDGTLSGEVVVAGPEGLRHTIAVHEQPIAEERCVGCDPHSSADDCANACEWTPMEWIELGTYSFHPPGRYRITGEGLRLSCAPDLTRFIEVEVDVDAGGMPHVVPQ